MFRGSYFRACLSVLVVVLVTTCLLLPAQADSPTVSTATVEGRLAVFDDVWQTINERYYDPHFHGVDWEKQRARYRNLAANARDENELYSILRNLISSLRDAHTRVFAPDEKFDWQHPRFITVGLSLREIEGHLIVVGVEQGSEAQRAGIRPGDVIETIDTEVALTRLRKRLAEQPESSTPQAARLFAVTSLLNGAPGTSVEIRWKDANDKRHAATLTRRWYQRTPGLRISWERGVAIITFDAFTHSIAIELARTLTNERTKLAKSHGIIIDLRGNGGGDAQAMAEMASAFLPPATALGQFNDRHGNVSLKIDTGVAPLYSARNSDPVGGTIVILASERTSSAAEIFISALKQTKRLTVIGTQTCGCVLAVRLHHALPDGGELAVSELDYLTAAGVRLEGTGIEPDAAVTVTRRSIYAGRDPALDTAFIRLRRAAHH